MKLYLPHQNDDQLKPPTFGSYEEFYLNGNVKSHSAGIVEKVSTIVDSNRTLFEINADAIERAEEMVLGSATGCFEDAWANLAPDAEQERNDEGMEQLIRNS